MEEKAPKMKKLSIEDKLGMVEDKRDTKLLAEIVERLPSASKVRLYKRSEDGQRKFITNIAVDDFDVSNPHEYVKSRFYDKYGGGDYYIELIDSGGDTVGKSIISLIDEVKEKGDERYARMIDEALDIREKAQNKVVEVEKKMREAEIAKYEAALDTINKNWEAMSKMYEKMIEDLRVRKEEAPSHLQYVIDGQIKSIEQKFEIEKMRMESEVRARDEGKAATEKMFELVNTLIPMVISRREGEKDPVQTFNETFALVEKITGGKKDIIESLLETPEKLKIFQRLMGIEEEKRKDFFGEIMESPEKAIVFRRLLGVEEKKDFFSDVLENPEKILVFRRLMGMEEKKDVFTEMAEHPEKALVFKRLMGLEDKKDFLTEVLDNPQKFEVLKKIMGVDKMDEMMKDIMEEASKETVVPVPQKSFIDEAIEAATKVDKLKSIFSPSQPVRSLIELAGVFFQNVAPHVVEGIKQVTNSMVTIEMIKQGYVRQLPDGSLVYNVPLQGAGRPTPPGPPPGPTPPKKKVREHKEPPIEPFGATTEEKGGKEEVNVEKMFEEIIIDVAASLSTSGPEIDTKIFIDKVSDIVVKQFQENPSIALRVLRYGDTMSINKAMSNVIAKVMGVGQDTSLPVAAAISNQVTEKIKGTG